MTTRPMINVSLYAQLALRAMLRCLPRACSLNKNEIFAGFLINTRTLRVCLLCVCIEYIWIFMVGVIGYILISKNTQNQPQKLIDPRYIEKHDKMAKINDESSYTNYFKLFLGFPRQRAKYTHRRIRGAEGETLTHA